MVQKSTIRIFAFIVLVIYLILLAWILFVKVGATDRSTYYKDPNDHFIPFQSTMSLLRLAKSYNYEGYYLHLLIKNIAGNFFLLFPFGIFLRILYPNISTIKNVILIAAAFSFSAELIQFVFSIGIFDIDDIILNTSGALLGLILTRWLCSFKSLKINII